MEAACGIFIRCEAACRVLKGKAGVDDDYSNLFRHQRCHYGMLFAGLFFLRFTVFTMTEKASSTEIRSVLITTL
jgi:hypothetical protein